MFGIVVLEMIPSVCCRSQKSTTSVHKLVIGGKSATKLSNHKLSEPVAWQPDLMRTIQKYPFAHFEAELPASAILT